MAKNIFDDITRKVSDVADSAMQMTKDRTDVAKMNNMLFKEEKVRRNLFTELGKQYFELHKDDAEDALKELVGKTAASQDLIDDLEKRVMYIRGRRLCPSCDSEMVLDAKFCSVCGKELPEVDIPAPMKKQGEPVCEGCGKPLQAEAKFCPYCGKEAPREDVEIVPESETEVVDNDKVDD